GKDIPEVSNVVLTPFSWSAEILRFMGCDAIWLGHPLKQMVAEQIGEPQEREAIAVLPGSRMHEVEYNLPIIAEEVKGMVSPVVFAAASSIFPDDLLEVWERCGGGPATVVDSAAKAFAQAKAAVVCSGTATLEGAICQCPMVVVYKGSKLMEIEARIRRPKVDFISLPNILLGRRLLPEFILWQVTVEAIQQALTPLLVDSTERAAQLQGFDELDASLGPDDAIDRSVGILWDQSSRTWNATAD
ncbi:MAG: hypothetical protein ABUL72_02820, partial [Armatimonadota bacterium]